MLNDKEFEDLKKAIEKATIELDELQRKYIHETGRRYVVPFRLEWPKLRKDE